MPDETVATPDWKAGSEALSQRRAEVRRWWHARDFDRQVEQPDKLVGLAISGGGIRSATFGLGVIQGLARTRDAFSHVDIVSTVSGGSYIGTFLRSLFVPDSMRGITPKISKKKDSSEGEAVYKPDPDEIAAQYLFARTALASDADKQLIESEDDDNRLRRNPLWWLREHSRYLAPNGASDYGYALAYVARNWAAMLYIFFIASLVIFSGMVLAEVIAYQLGFVWHWLALEPPPAVPIPCGACRTLPGKIVPISPIVFLLILPAVASLVLSTAYWMTEAMSPNEPNPKWQWRNLGKAVLGTLAGAIIVLGVSAVFGYDIVHPWSFVGDEGREADRPFVLVVVAGAIVAASAAILAFLVALSLRKRSPFTGELRRRLTSSLAWSNKFFLIILALVIVDSAGASLEHWLRFDRGSTPGGIGAIMLPILAFLIQKIPDWFGGVGKGKFGSIILRLAAPLATLAGIALFGMVAVAASAVAHGFTWRTEAWASPPAVDRLVLLIFATWVLAWLSGRSDGFINLSSLHFFYASRLTRAYLGASNNVRLRNLAARTDSGLEAIDQDGRAPTGKETEADKKARRATAINRNQDGDYIQPYHYSRADLPAPIHILNCTINETIDPSSELVARDRKGEQISVEPCGVRIGETLYDWSRVGKQGVAEQISLGQWCAISGAAASSGMGRLTNLGFALALTFANVRLGYWWYAPGLSPPHHRAGPIKTWLARQAATFIYLGKEMTARYSLQYERKYLTDGGHFENSGAYGLIRRRVPLIVVTDNAADPDYTFGDLEALVRLARLDLGAELNVLTGADLKAFLATLGTPTEAATPSIFVDCKDGRDWRRAFKSRDGNAYVLVMRAECDGGPLHIFWLKPRLLRGLPPDVSSYAISDATFPQQTTGDQFFDEAQWESYRKLGEISMARLLEACPRLLA